jgi:hypothetical protein
LNTAFSLNGEVASPMLKNSRPESSRVSVIEP